MWRVRARCVCACVSRAYLQRGGGGEMGGGGVQMGGDSSCLPAAQFREGKQATPPARSSCAVPTPEAFVWHTARSCGEAPAKYEVHLYSHWLAIGLGKVAAGGFVLSVPAPSVLSPVVAVPVVVFAPSAKTNRQRQTIARNISEATLRTIPARAGTEFAKVSPKNLDF